MTVEFIALFASLVAILGQAANAYLKMAILKELSEREQRLLNTIHEHYVPREVCARCQVR